MATPTAQSTLAKSITRMSGAITETEVAADRLPTKNASKRTAGTGYETMPELQRSNDARAIQSRVRATSVVLSENATEFALISSSCHIPPRGQDKPATHSDTNPTARSTPRSTDRTVHYVRLNTSRAPADHI